MKIKWSLVVGACPILQSNIRESVYKDTTKGNNPLKLIWSKWGSQCRLLSWIWKALQCVAISHWSSGFSANEEYLNISLKHMYLYLSLAESKVAEFYHNIDRRRYLVWLKWLIFIALSRHLMVSLQNKIQNCRCLLPVWQATFQDGMYLRDWEAVVVPVDAFPQYSSLTVLVVSTL